MDNLQEILKDTYSTASLKHRLRVLKSYISNHIFSNQSKEELAASDSTWLSTLSPAFYQQFNAQNTTEIFNTLDARINQLQILTIFLPFESDDQTTKEIGTFARKIFTSEGGAYDKILILDIKFDPNLTAGCALSWNGVYKDYSLKSKIHERKSDILESFKRFLQ